MTTNIILAGFMGTGKSTVGQLIAGRLGLEFVDTDAAVEHVAGTTIPELFARSEALFRQYESVVCLQCALHDGLVMAVGGGALLNENTRAGLEMSGVIICLHADIDEIMRRVGEDGHRPLFGSRADVDALLAARIEHYASLPYHVDTTGKTPEQVADEVIALWQHVTS